MSLSMARVSITLYSAGLHMLLECVVIELLARCLSNVKTIRLKDHLLMLCQAPLCCIDVRAICSCGSLQSLVCFIEYHVSTVAVNSHLSSSVSACCTQQSS